MRLGYLLRLKAGSEMFLPLFVSLLHARFQSAILTLESLVGGRLEGEAEILTNTFFDSVCQVKYRSIYIIPYQLPIHETLLTSRIIFPFRWLGFHRD